MNAALLALTSLLAAAGADPSQGRDFHLGHSGWNGLSRLGGLARDLACSVEVRRTLDWSQLDGQDILFVLHPETPLDTEAALSYLTVGGRMIIADDYGQAGPLLSRLGIVRVSGPVPAGAVRAMDGTPFQSAMTSCGFPSNSHFPSLFRSLIGGRPGEIEVEDPSEEDAAEEVAGGAAGNLEVEHLGGKDERRHDAHQGDGALIEVLAGLTPGESPFGVRKGAGPGARA